MLPLSSWRPTPEAEPLGRVRVVDRLVGVVASVIVTATLTPAGQLSVNGSVVSPAVAPVFARSFGYTLGKLNVSCGVVTLQLLTVMAVPVVSVNVPVTVVMQLPEKVTVMLGSETTVPGETGPLTTRSARR
ncbi:conserved hypothetical protein [Paraburkholderia sabiae]|nr:conserved hypothetical protein [Paraburkholderia sabiae]